MKFLKNSLIGLFLAGLTGGLLAYAGSLVAASVQERMAREQPNRPVRERVYAANVVVAEASKIVPEITTFGEIRSVRTLEVRVPVGGAIIELSPNFVEGGVVSEGEILMVVDPSDAQSTVDLATADKRDAEVELNDAERALEIAREELLLAERQLELRRQSLTRQLELRDRGVGTDIAVESAELAVSAASQTELARKKAVDQNVTRVGQAESLVLRRSITLDEAYRRLADTKLVAEFGGTLSEVNVVRGGLVNTNERIAQLIDPDVLEVSFRISNQQYSRVIGSDGQLRPLPVSLEGAFLTGQARIVRESAKVQEGQTGRLLFASIEGGRRSGLRPGDFVEVTIREPPLDNVLMLPAAAADTDRNLLIVGENERLEERPAELLRKQGNQIIVAASGLEGRMIVAERSPLIGAGIRIRPIAPDNAGVPETPQNIALTDEERQQLVAFVEANQRMPDQVKERILTTLQQETVPISLVERLRGRM